MFKPNPDRTLANANVPQFWPRYRENSTRLLNVVIDTTGYYAARMNGKLYLLGKNPNYKHGMCCRPI